jgi:hypothetical protein
MSEHLRKSLGTGLEGERIGMERLTIRRRSVGLQTGRTLCDELEKGAHQVRGTMMAVGEQGRVAEYRADGLVQGSLLVAALYGAVLGLPAAALAIHPMRSGWMGRGQVERARVTDSLAALIGGNPDVAGLPQQDGAGRLSRECMGGDRVSSQGGGMVDLKEERRGAGDAGSEHIGPGKGSLRAGLNPGQGLAKRLNQ